MSVLVVLLITPGLAATLTPRPADLVPPGQQAAYEQWFARRAAELTRLHATAACTAPLTRSLSYRLVGPSTVFHSADAQAQIAGNVYREAYAAEGCGPLARQNLVVARLRSGGWRGIGALPGTSLADPFLQNDASKLAAAAALNRPAPGCSPEAARMALKIVDTALTSPQPPPGGMWTERWTFTTCGLPAAVKMTFVPSPQGGTNFTALRE